MKYPLDVYHKTKHARKLKTEIEILSKELIKLLSNWFTAMLINIILIIYKFNSVVFKQNIFKLWKLK